MRFAELGLGFGALAPSCLIAIGFIVLDIFLIRKRRRKFSLAKFMLWVSIVAVVLGKIIVVFREPVQQISVKKRESWCVEQLAQQGAFIQFDNRNSSYLISFTPRHELNDQKLRSVVPLFKNLSSIHLDFNRSSLTDESMYLLSELNDVTSLSLRFSMVSDKGMEFVSNMQSLRVLNIRDTPVDSAGIKHLLGCKSLTDLHIGNSGDSSTTHLEMDSSLLATLKEFRSLKRLQVSNDLFQSEIDELKKQLDGVFVFQ